LWARVLLANPDARLVLKADQAADHEVQRRLRADFGRHGILPERLTFLGYSHSVADHLALYAEVDVALDPFPYNGTTTTCEALWMGVPVVALAGDRLVGRVGFSLLAAVGHEGLVAGDAAEYVGIATALMDDRARLRDLRHGLRADVAGSPLRDEIGFARALETAYMDMLSRV
jgi:predicted O-linked N-acetylglucosamine transferase (SPINDLY family)